MNMLGKIKQKKISAQRNAKMYPWLLWGFVVWFFVIAGLFYGIIGDMAATPGVPDWAVPYNKKTAEKVRTVAAGYPIAAMGEYIARFDEQTAAYLVSIAKKESDWGRHVPVAGDGKDCYNYWGFRDLDNMDGSGGHTCFESPERAVRAVGKRIRELVHTYKRDTPKEMAVWKCGMACDFSDVSTTKWVSDVSWYRDQFIGKEKK